MAAAIINEACAQTGELERMRNHTGQDAVAVSSHA